jgi:hypothetical protein
MCLHRKPPSSFGKSAYDHLHLLHHQNDTGLSFLLLPFLMSPFDLFFALSFASSACVVCFEQGERQHGVSTVKGEWQLEAAVAAALQE